LIHSIRCRGCPLWCRVGGLIAWGNAIDEKISSSCARFVVEIARVFK
jgi:hypothetical protein